MFLSEEGMEKMKGSLNGWPNHSKFPVTGTGQRYCQDAPIVLRCFRFWRNLGHNDIGVQSKGRAKVQAQPADIQREVEEILAPYNCSIQVEYFPSNTISLPWPFKPIN
jgi:hypothetical protein